MELRQIRGGSLEFQYSPNSTIACDRMLDVSPPMSSSNSASGYGVRTDFSGPEPGVPQSAGWCDVDQQRLYEAVPLVGRVIGVENR